MLPAALFTVSTPPATSHFAGDLSWAETHWSRFLPSKSTIASEGGAASLAPGVTILGTGFHTSVASGFCSFGFCAKQATAASIKTPTEGRKHLRIIIETGYTAMLIGVRAILFHC